MSADLELLAQEDGSLFVRPDPILAASRWRDNAALIADMASLGYLQRDWLTLDPTYGRGLWWTRWRPDQLVTHDLRSDGVDFRALPEPEGSFDAAVFDPPYIAPGGRESSTVEDFNDRYGLHETPATPTELQAVIDAGVSELCRVLRPGGMLLVKCQDYQSSNLWIGTHHVLTHALALGFVCIDRLEHLRNIQPQPGGRTQRHARRNLSTLLVLRKSRS